MGENAEVGLAIGGLLSIGHNVNVSFDADDLELNLVKAIIFLASILNCSASVRPDPPCLAFVDDIEEPC